MWKEVLRTSEFWVALLGGVLQVLISHGLVSQADADVVRMAGVYVVSRIISKVAKGTIPVSGPALKVVPPAALFIATTLALWSSPARAQKAESLAYYDRVEVGVGAGFDWHANADQQALGNEFTAGAHLAYVLTAHSLLAVPVTYGFANQLVRVSPQLRWRVHVAGDSFALALGYDVNAGAHLPAVPHEWAAGALYARPLWKAFTIGGGVSWGLDSHELRTSIGIRLPLISGKDS